jgi:prepilin-type N-terminal cleavage/methylation domain-containing protein
MKSQGRKSKRCQEVTPDTYPAPAGSASQLSSPPKRESKGFTTVEMLIAMALSAIILSAFVSLYIYSGRASLWRDQGVQANREGRMTMMRLVKDLRHAGLIAPEDCDGDSNDIMTDVLGQAFTDSINEVFEEATWNALAFQADVDNDSLTETVRYLMDGDHLRRFVWRWSRDSTDWIPDIEGRVVGNNVDFVMFSYFDADNVQIPDPLPSPYQSLNLNRHERAGIRTVRIDLITRSPMEDLQKVHTGYYPDSSTYDDGFLRHHITSNIMCRNLK